MSFKNILNDTSYFYIVEYYVQKNNNVCFMVKIFIKPLFQYFLVYIDKENRFIIDNKNSPYVILEEIFDSEENDDFIKTQRKLNYNMLTKTINTNIYSKDVYENYNKQIYTESEDEPEKRKVKREIERLNYPLLQFDYTISISNFNIIAFYHRKKNLRLFKAQKNVFTNILFMFELKDLNNIDNIISELLIVYPQLYTTIENSSLFALEEVNKNISNYNKIINVIKSKYKIEKNNITQYLEKYKSIKLQEEKIITNAKNKIKIAQNIEKTTINEDAKKEINDLYRKNNEICIKVMESINKYHEILLKAEGLGFDTNIMIKRININLEKLEKIS